MGSDGFEKVLIGTLGPRGTRTVNGTGPSRPQRSDEHFFKTIRAHVASKLPPTLETFRTRSNPTLAQP